MKLSKKTIIITSENILHKTVTVSQQLHSDLLISGDTFSNIKMNDQDSIQNENRIIIQVLTKLQNITLQLQSLSIEVENLKSTLITQATINIPIDQKQNAPNKNEPHKESIKDEIHPTTHDNTRQTTILQHTNRNRQSFGRTILNNTKFSAFQHNVNRRFHQTQNPDRKLQRRERSAEPISRKSVDNT